MDEYDANKFFSTLKRAQQERTARRGFDDNSLYNMKRLEEVRAEDHEKFKRLEEVCAAAKSKKKSDDVEINAQGFTDEQHAIIKAAKRKQKSQRTPEESELIKQHEAQQRLIRRRRSDLRELSIRIPLMIYGANIPLDEDFTIDMLFDDNIVDNKSWEEFMPKGWTKEDFKYFIDFYDEDVFIGAGHYVRKLANNADELPPTERVIRIAKLFYTFKNPDKETVLTPFRVVNIHLSETLGGWDFFDEDHENILDSPRFVDNGDITAQTLSNTNAKILEINSKTGLYPLFVAYSLYRKKLGDRDEISLPMDHFRKYFRPLQNSYG